MREEELINKVTEILGDLQRADIIAVTVIKIIREHDAPKGQEHGGLDAVPFPDINLPLLKGELMIDHKGRKLPAMLCRQCD